MLNRPSPASWMRLKSLAAIVSISIFAACGKPQPPPAAPPPVPVTVAGAVGKDVAIRLSAVGNVEAFAAVSVKSQVNGELKEVRFTEGRDVRQGSLLFQIDPRPFETDLRRSEASLARNMAVRRQAEANLARDLAQAANAAEEAERYRLLSDRGVASRERYDQTKAANEALQAAVSADRAAIETAGEAMRADQAAIESARIQLGYCTIRSPIDGIAGSLMLHRGNLVKANDTMAMVVILQVEPVRVSFTAPERYLTEIRRSQAAGKVAVEATASGEPGAPVRGSLDFVDNTVNPATGTIILKALFANRDRRLWPGQYVDVTMNLGVQPGAIVVPSQAVQAGQAGSFVFVVKPDQTAEIRPVTPGRSAGGETVIEKGLAAGETVVTDGQLRLFPGARVQVKKGLQPKQERPS